MTRPSLLRRLSLPTAHVVDAAFAITLTLLGLAGFQYAFGRIEYMVVGTIGAFVGAGIALVIIRLRFPGLFALALVAVGFLVVGSVGAVRDQVTAGIIPKPSAFTGLIDGTVTGWRKLLTTLPPSGSLGNLLAVPFLCGYLSALVATLLACRTKFLASLTIMPSIVLILSVLFGDRKPYSLVVQGGLFVTVSIGWLAVRRARERRSFMQSSGRKRLVGGLVMLALIGAAGFEIGPNMPFANAESRYVFQREDPPFDPSQYGSPLNGYDKFLNGALKDKVMFTVSGLPLETDPVTGKQLARVRLATLDDYNGVVWEVDPLGSTQSSRFIRVGETVQTDAAGKSISLAVKVTDLPGVWIPDAGVFTGISWRTSGDRGATQRNGFRLNTDTQTGVDPVGRGLTAGDSYQVRGIVPGESTPSELETMHIDTALRTKVSGQVPDTLRAKAGEIVKGLTHSYDIAKALEKWFLDHGYYTAGDTASGQSKLLSGHSAARMAAFILNDQPVGSSEQYAAAMALMARTVGLPARVVMGFRVESPGTATIKGDNVDAWVEIPFINNAGRTTWVTFDPSPRNKTGKPPPEPSKLPRPKYQSQDVPPPPLPPPPVDVVELKTGKAPTKEPPKKRAETTPTPPQSHLLLVAITAGVGSPLLIVLLLASAVLLLKRRRRRRRRKAAYPSLRMAGAWDEYLDVARDVGLPVPNRATRHEASLLVSAPSATWLSQRADEAVFGPGDLTQPDIDEFWLHVENGCDELRATVPWRKRFWSRLSVTSLRVQRP